jgi:hypothetical protein
LKDEKKIRYLKIDIFILMNQTHQQTGAFEHPLIEKEERFESQKIHESEERISGETIDENFSFKNFEKNLKIFQELEVFLFSPTDENINKAKTLINKYKVSLEKNHIFGMINFAAEHRPFHFRSYYLLLKDTNIDLPNYLDQSDFISYLYLLDVYPKSKINKFKNSNKTIEEYENVFQKDSIFSFVSKDDLASIVILSSSIDLQKQKTRLLYENINLSDLSIFCGSTKCFKYFLINSFQVTNESVKWSIRGGNEEIIQFLEQQGHSFDNFLSFSIEFHHNDLFKWLLENSKNDKIYFSESIDYYNLTILLNFLKTNNIEHYRSKCLISSSKIGILFLIDYFLSHGSDIESHDYLIFHIHHDLFFFIFVS